DVLPVMIVPGPGEVLCADVGVEPVREQVADRPDVPAGSARGLEHGDVVAALHQLVGATEPADPRATADDPPRRPPRLPTRSGRLRRRESRGGPDGGEAESIASVQARAGRFRRYTGRGIVSHRWTPHKILSDAMVVATGRRAGSPACERPHRHRQL